SAAPPTATRSTVTFSKPTSTSTLSRYGGTTATPTPTATLVGKGGAVDKPAVNGTLVVDPSGTSATFKASSIYLSTFFGSSVLPNGTWNVTLTSGTGTGATANGFFDKDNVPLDGGNNGGHANFTTTFVTANDGKP